MGEWQTIESAPKDGREVDLWVRPHDAFANGNPGRVPNAAYKDGAWWRPIGGVRAPVVSCGVPTHWLPLPAPPAVAKEGT